jgi:hypothetical protein
VPKSLTLTCIASALLAAACASQQYDSAREWQRAECNKVIDKEDRDRCLRRVDDDHGRREREAPPAARK